MNKTRSLAVALCLALLPPAAQAAPDSIRGEIKQDMDEARREIRSEMASARAELANENLSLGDGLHIDGQGKHKADLPNAEISRSGDLLIDGKAVAIDARQRRQLLDYRGQVIDIARLGIDAGERAAMAAIDATDVSLFSLIFGGLSGSLERRIESTVKQHVEPMVKQICARLPQVLASQQALAASLPQFRPYASLNQGDIDDCRRDMRDALAVR